MRSLRVDRGVLARPSTTSGGAFVIEGHAARAHLTVSDALNYGDHVERRSLDEVRAIVKQLVGVPITWDHPSRFFREDPNAATRIGVITDAWLDGEHAAFRATITDAAAIRAIRAGMQMEISLGYETEVVGGWQTKISVDHAAVVQRGRCGNSCRIADHAHTEGYVMDKDLLAAAAATNVRIDGLDEKGVALAVLRACGVDPKGPRAGDRTETIDSMPDAYITTRAIIEAEQSRRDQMDAARRDTFATAPAKRANVPACGCGGAGHGDGKLNAPVTTEALARRTMMRDGANAWQTQGDDANHRDEEQPTRHAPARGDGSAEAKARAAMVAASATAHRATNNTTETEEE